MNLYKDTVRCPRAPFGTADTPMESVPDNKQTFALKSQLFSTVGIVAVSCARIGL